MSFWIGPVFIPSTSTQAEAVKRGTPLRRRGRCLEALPRPGLFGRGVMGRNVTRMEAETVDGWFIGLNEAPLGVIWIGPRGRCLDSCWDSN